jgi:glycosyltransferase involved in cell wall biosynthesis
MRTPPQQKTEKLKVLVVGQTPPPYGGQSIMIERMLQSDMADVEMIHVRMSFSSDVNEIGHVRASKFVHLLAIIARIIYHRFADRVRMLYYPPAGPDRVPMFRDMVILIATRWLFDKTVFHYHAGGISELYEQLPGWQRWLFRRAYFGADAAVRLSELNPEDGRRLEAKQDYVIPCGIDDPCPGFAFSRPRFAATPDAPLKILFVGIVMESKGVLVLIDACAELAARGVPFELEIMGHVSSAEFDARLKRRIQELKLEQQVRFLGVLLGEEKSTAFRRADVFCLPTFFNCETFGIVLVEAMAHGLPDVSTRWRGIPSVVDDGETGFLVETHDPKGLADRIATLADDGELRERMGDAGRAKFEREYSFPRFVNRMRRMFLETAAVALDSEDEANAVDDDGFVANAPMECELHSTATAAAEAATA